jgi:hypothetical protein
MISSGSRGNGKKDGQLLKFTMDGKFVLQIGRQGEGNDSNATDRLGSPADVAVDVAAKEVLRPTATPTGASRWFDARTAPNKRHWGAYGNKPSDEKTPRYDPAKPPSRQFGNPVHCIRLGKDGWIYGCDRTNNPAAGFPQGRHRSCPSTSTRRTRAQRNGRTTSCLSPDAAQKAFIYMIDGMNGEVRGWFDRSLEGSSSTRFGRPGRQAGQFTALHNIAVDRQGKRLQPPRSTRAAGAEVQSDRQRRCQ